MLVVSARAKERKVEDKGSGPVYAIVRFSMRRREVPTTSSSAPKKSLAS
jgi:hypothetical protein